MPAVLMLGVFGGQVDPAFFIGIAIHAGIRSGHQRRGQHQHAAGLADAPAGIARRAAKRPWRDFRCAHSAAWTACRYRRVVRGSTRSASHPVRVARHLNQIKLRKIKVEPGSVRNR